MKSVLRKSRSRKGLRINDVESGIRKQELRRISYLSEVTVSSLLLDVIV